MAGPPGSPTAGVPHRRRPANRRGVDERPRPGCGWPNAALRPRAGSENERYSPRGEGWPGAPGRSIRSRYRAAPSSRRRWSTADRPARPGTERAPGSAVVRHRGPDTPADGSAAGIAATSGGRRDLLSTANAGAGRRPLVRVRVVGDRSADRWPEGDERRVVWSPATPASWEGSAAATCAATPRTPDFSASRSADAIPIARRWYRPTQPD